MTMKLTEIQTHLEDLKKEYYAIDRTLDFDEWLTAQCIQLSKEFKDADMRCGKVGALYEEYKALYEKTLGRVNGLEEWLTEYRNELKRKVYHTNEGLINDINELLDEL